MQLARFPPKRIHKQALSAPGRLIEVLELLDEKALARILHELQVCATALLEAEIDDGRGTGGQEVGQCLQKEREGRLEVDAVGGEDVRCGAGGEDGR